MTSTRTRAGRVTAGFAVLALLAGCTTSVEGAGRPRDPVPSGGVSASSSDSSSASPSGTGGGVTADGDAHETWKSAIAASVGAGGTVRVRGVISGAGVGGASISAAYAIGGDGKPVAQVGIGVPEGSLSIVATGGSAWAQASAAVYQAYGYDAAGSAQADGKQVQLTDDDSGLDVYAALESFLSLCGPTGDDPASLEDGEWEGKAAVVVNDEKYATKAYVDPASGHVLASVYEDETVTFEYSGDTLSVAAPSADQVVTVDGF